MPVQEQLNIIYQILQAGRSIPIEEVIEIVPDVGTGLTVQGTTEVATLGNGMATEVTSLVVDSTATEVSTAGVGLLALDVGAVGIAIAPALGILAGVGLYSLAPEFWTNVSNQLLNAGETIGGKVRAFINGETKEVGFSAETIEIFKQAFIEAGLFEGSYEPEPITQYNPQTSYPVTSIMSFNGVVHTLQSLSGQSYNSLVEYALENIYDPNYPLYQGVFYKDGSYAFIERFNYTSVTSFFVSSVSSAGYLIISSLNNNDSIRNNNYVVYDHGRLTSSTGLNQSIIAPYNITNRFAVVSGLLGSYIAENLQPNATYPTVDPFPQTYPTWNPWSVPVEGFPDVYPIEIPLLNPEADQSEAQNPNPLPDDNPDLLPWFIENLPQPAPDPNPYPEPSPVPDPDPQPEPEPMPEPSEPDTDPNPVDPNPDPSDPYLPIIPEVPDTVPANAMFTVYKPTISQVNSFGAWLWSNSIMEAIKRIWQNPLDGIISFMKVYVDAPTSGSDTIKVGMLDSEVSSAVVTSQFVTVECGTIDIKEKFYNATDYSPFVSLHIYLPFIGIAELDIDEFMSGEIKVTYHVDVYTGTCLAEIKARRSYDKPDWTIIYTFSGNASQQLPLTSSSFSGAISSLVSIVGGGLAIASGGGLGLLAGATGLAHAVTHEMVHLAHSGSLSANAGIMGARKPFLIITRRRSYDANGYNELYGYPSNKTVFLNNCSGFIKVKDIQLKTSATDVENKEIETLLKNGVIM